MNLPLLSGNQPFPNVAPRTRNWAEIDLTVLRGNLAAIRTICGPDAQPMIVLKANAYGHGLLPIARACVTDGIQHFAVATVDEGRALRRQAGVNGNIYLLTPFLPEEADEIVRLDLTPTISSLSQLTPLRLAANAAPLPARCLLAIDTGMGREGALPEAAQAIYRDLCLNNGAIHLCGITTHFACADEPDADTVSAEQTRVFTETVRALDAIVPFVDLEDGRGERGLFLSTANSPATTRFTEEPLPPGVRFRLKRCGLLTHGIEPYPDSYRDLPGIQPTLTWRARLTLLRDLPAGSAIGYGLTHTLTRPSRIATIAVGYADGLSRRLSNFAAIILQGRRYPIVGRVSMDQCQVDVTDAGDALQVGDIATLIGRDGDASMTAREMAQTAGTTPHEPTCALSIRVPRIYVNS